MAGGDAAARTCRGRPAATHGAAMRRRRGGPRPQRGTPLACYALSMRIAPKYRRIGSLQARCLVCTRPPPRAGRGATVSDPQDIAGSSNRWRNRKRRCNFRSSPIASASWSARSSRILQFEKCNRPSPGGRLAAAHEGSSDDRTALPGPQALASICAGQRSSAPHRLPSRCTPLSLGASSRPRDLESEQHDISELPLGFLDDPAIAVGLTASRPIPGGAYHYQSAAGGRQGRAARPIGDLGRGCRRHERAHGGQGFKRWPDESDGLRSRICHRAKIVEGIARSEQVVEIISQ